MSIRLPVQTVVTANVTDVGTASVAGGLGFPFQIPLDTDNVVVKFVASVTAGGMSTIFQTSDDGGATYYDVARTSIVSNGQPQWLSIPVISGGMSNVVVPSLIATGSIVGVSTTPGTAAASTLGSRQISGLPILGTQNRLFHVYTGAITASSVVATVRLNSQSGGR